MNIYSILFRHYSQKDSKRGIMCFLKAESDEEVYEWLKSDPTIGDDWITTCYSDEENDDKGFKNRLISCKGQMFDDEYEPSDLYYGATVYGWEYLGEYSNSCLSLLEHNNLLYDSKDYI